MIKVLARATMISKEGFRVADHRDYQTVKVSARERRINDVKPCANLLTSSEMCQTIQVARDGAHIKIRLVNTEGANYERYVGGMDLDFSNLIDGEDRAKKIEEALLGD